MWGRPKRRPPSMTLETSIRRPSVNAASIWAKTGQDSGGCPVCRKASHLRSDRSQQEEPAGFWDQAVGIMDGRRHTTRAAGHNTGEPTPARWIATQGSGGQPAHRVQPNRRSSDRLAGVTATCVVRIAAEAETVTEVPVCSARRSSTPALRADLSVCRQAAS